MHVIHPGKDINVFLYDLCVSLQRDFYCWNNWLLMHVEGGDVQKKLDEEGASDVARQLYSQFKDHDGAIALLPDHSVMVLLQKKKQYTQGEIASQLNHERKMHVPFLKVRTFRAREDQGEIVQLLRSHVDPMIGFAARGKNEKEILKNVFPDIGSVMRVWMEACRYRKTRNKPQVMVVDDDPVTCHIISKSLKDDYQLLTAHGYVEAIRKHFLFGPDIIFLDISLPDGSGYDILEHIRNYDAHARIIMFSGNDNAQNRLKALAAGAAGFVEKPFQRKNFDHYLALWKNTVGKGIGTMEQV